MSSLNSERPFSRGRRPQATTRTPSPTGLTPRSTCAMSNAHLRSALRDIRGHLARLRRHAHSNPERLQQASGEHLLIVNAIIRQDEVLAAQATAVHLRNSLDHILSTLDHTKGTT